MQHRKEVVWDLYGSSPRKNRRSKNRSQIKWGNLGFSNQLRKFAVHLSQWMILLKLVSQQIKMPNTNFHHFSKNYALFWITPRMDQRNLEVNTEAVALQLHLTVLLWSLKLWGSNREECRRKGLSYGQRWIHYQTRDAVVMYRPFSRS